MSGCVAIFAGLGLAIMLSESRPADWTPSFLVVAGILAFILVGSLIAAALEGRARA